MVARRPRVEVATCWSRVRRPGSAGDGDEHRLESGLLVAEVLQAGGQLAGERAQGSGREVEAEEFDGDPGDREIGVTGAGVDLVETVAPTARHPASRPNRPAAPTSPPEQFWCVYAGGGSGNKWLRSRAYG
jgi:hypothetical protein